jgi:putative ABC transport system ATP-binding protein
MPAAFVLRDVRYRDLLEIPDLEIPANSLYCITGESGAGKSTLLKLLNNMITCDRGSIAFGGEDILSTDPVALRREVVMVPQSPFILPATVMDNIAMAFRFAQKTIPPAGDISSLLAGLGLPVPLERDAASLSGGEKQRLALVRALLLDPAVLLLDEPTAALDEETSEKVMGVLSGRVKKDGKTVIMVTHARGIADGYGDYVLNLTHGRPGSLSRRGAEDG